MTQLLRRAKKAQEQDTSLETHTQDLPQKTPPKNTPKKSFSFSSSIVPPSFQEVPEPEENESSRFKQGDEAMRLKFKGDPASSILDKKTGQRTRLLTYIHYLKFLSPLLNKASEIGEPEQHVEILQKWIQNANTFACQTVELLGKIPNDPNLRWLVNSLERIYIETVISEVSDIRNTAYDPKLTIKLHETIMSNIDNFTSLEGEEFAEVPDMNLELELLYYKEITKAWTQYQRFSLFIPEELFLNNFTRFLQDTADEFFNRKITVKSLLSGKDKMIYYKVIAKEITNVFISIWKKQSNILFREMNETKQAGENFEKSYLGFNPEGFPMDQLFEQTRRRLEQIDNLVKTVVKF